MAHGPVRTQVACQRGGARSKQASMSSVLTLVSNPEHRPLTSAHVDAARGVLADLGAQPGPADWLDPDIAIDIPFTGIEPSICDAAFAPVPELSKIDRAAQPVEGRRKRILVADMDSTMITIETLDTLAAELGFRDEVEAVTARAMNGELEFVESLRARVALLEGFTAAKALDAVMAKVTHSPGAERAVRTMAASGCFCALVSGGFTFTTDIVHRDLGFHTHRANRLEIVDGTFTGRVVGDIVGRQTKLETLEALCAERRLGRDLAASVGDGANDLDMLMAAGLGVGYRGKPIVRREAPFRIDHTDMTTLLYYQGYRRQDFVL